MNIPVTIVPGMTHVDMTHIVVFIGRWSMIDIFMEALLGALVVFGTVITIKRGASAVAFCAGVLLTMLGGKPLIRG